MSPYPKVIVQTFENYAKSQLTFVQNVAELANKPSYAECLYESHAVETVLPLVTNANATVRVNAVLGLARMAGNSEPCAKLMVCSKSQLSRMFGQIPKENKYYKKNCLNLVKNLSKHPSVNIEILVKECGGIDAILTCIKDFDPMVRESALQAIGSIARQDANISKFIVTSGVLPPIVMCLKDKEHNLKLFALSALDEMAKHNQELAQTIVDVPTLPQVTNMLSSKFTDVKVQRSALILIKNIVKHSLFLTENAIESNLFPDVLTLTKHPDESIRDGAAKVICEVVKHSVQIAQLVVNNGGIAALMNVISCSQDLSSVAAVLAMGYIAAMSPALASSVIQALPLLINILSSDKDKNMKAGVVWTLGMIGQHGPEHAREIWASEAVTIMMDIFAESSPEDECRHKCKVALQMILNGCDDYAFLESLLTQPPPAEMMTYILEKISKILPTSSKARRRFITNGHLKSIQNIVITPDGDPYLFEVVKAVNCCFPEDVLQMVAGDFPETVMKTVDKYVPKSNCLFYSNRPTKSDEQQSYFSAKNPVYGAEESFLE